MKMSMIPKEHVTKVWVGVSGYIESAVNVIRLRHDIVDVMEDCLKGRQVLWIVFDEDNREEIVAALTTMVIVYPQYRALSIPYMGGRGMMRYRELIVATLSSFARDIGCTSIEAYGRDAWGRLGKKFGFRKSFSVFELDLSEQKQMAAE